MKTTKSVHAFSLIEMIGVLAIIAILAAAIVPRVVKRIDLAAYDAESTSLNSMSSALLQYVTRSNTIPNSNTWAQAISSELGLSQGNVLTTPRKWSRAYVIDAGGWLPYALASGPWSQTLAGTVATPTNARVMLIATLSQDLPVTSGAPLSAANFQNIWSTPPLTKPSTWGGWAGKGEDLVIQHINLQPLFHRVILVNGTGGQGQFSINNSSPATVVPAGADGVDSFYIDGTLLGLHNTNSVMVAQEVVRADVSRVFEYGVWRDQINLGVTTFSTSFSGIGALAAQFFTNSASPSTSWGQTPAGIMEMMSSYMDGYNAWAGMAPCFSYSGPGNSYKNGNFAPYNEISGALGTSGVVP